METPFRWLLLSVLALILVSLGEGMYFLIRDSGTERSRVVRALTARLLFSFLLFFLLIGGSLLGVI